MQREDRHLAASQAADATGDEIAGDEAEGHAPQAHAGSGERWALRSVIARRRVTTITPRSPKQPLAPPT
jgi:hypothetical protein